MKVAKNSEARINANNRYRYKAYDTLQVAVRKEKRINDLLDFATKKTGKSKAQYVVDAIDTQLERDGISIDMLPAVDITIPRGKPGRKRMLKEYMVYEALIVDKEISGWEDSIVVTLDLEEARSKLQIAVRKSSGDPNDLPYIRGWKFTAYNKKEAIDKCKEMIDSMEIIMDDNDEIESIINHVREPDYTEGLDG